MRLQICSVALTAVLLIGANAGLAQDAKPAQDVTQIQTTRLRSKPWPDRTKVWPRHWYKDWAWWVGEFAIAGIQAIDADSTSVARSQCPACTERNLLLGKHPSDTRIIVVSNLNFALISTFHVLSWKACPDPNRRSRAWRIGCNALVPSIDAGIVIPGAIHNYGLHSAPISMPRSQSFAVPMPGQSFKTVVSKTTGQELLLPKWYGGCGHSLTLCTSPFTTDEQKIERRSEKSQ